MNPVTPCHQTPTHPMAIIHKDILVTVGYRPALKVKQILKIFLYLGYLLG
jgi:hypothetical protein